ncbi:diacylglycerol kinase [Paenibacillus phyllosphaerae]|uniref:Diacylglycerol kinase n=1 Tax=Paenibacillus phyllosphaerae TaxID=274593 RepID=A0A7W5AVF3_9BACL|nr:diacylglycerol kinase family protein [Paenibacillus phyllosphaerae]MBB3109006.1 diacylglycerol kinase [Paenibacillus phyllosphaerae]
MRQFLRNLGYALEGVGYAARTQRHMRFHLFAAAAVIVLGSWLGLSPGEWIVVVLLIAAVLSAELINTAIECVVDLVSPDYHKLAKAAKDTAAAAVLITAAAAVVVGAILFIPHLMDKLGL